jgi:hypothetical protein
METPRTPRRRPFWQDPEAMPVPSGRMLLAGLTGVTIFEGKRTKSFWTPGYLEVYPIWQLFQPIGKSWLCWISNTKGLGLIPALIFNPVPFALRIMIAGKKKKLESTIDPYSLGFSIFKASHGHLKVPMHFQKPL